jgi:hypothetical protein
LARPSYAGISKWAISLPDRKNLPVGSSISFWEGVLVIHGDHLDQCQTSGSGSAHVAATPMQLDEPVVLDAAAQTRIVSAGQNLVDPRKSIRPFKGIICADVSEFESFSIGAGWCQALSDCSVNLTWDVTRRVRASLRARHLGLPMMGSGGCGGPIYRGILAVRLTAGIRTRNGLASSIVPCGDIAPPADRSRSAPVGTGRHASSVQCRAHHCGRSC